MWNLRQNLESSGHQEKYKSHTALRKRCCIDTKRCSGGYTQPQVLRLRWHKERPWWTREQFTFMWNLRQNLESSGHQEKYKSHTALRKRCCIDTKRCSGGYTQPQVLRLRWHKERPWWTREQFTFMWNLRQNLESSGHQEKYKSHTALRKRCCIDTKRCSGGYTQPQVLRLRWHKERPWWTREQFTFMWNLRQNLESSGHQEKYKSHTSVGRKFAPVEGLSHDLVCTGSIYDVHFAWQVWHGQLSPRRFKFNKLKSFSGVEIDQNHVDKRILGERVLQ